MRGKSGSISRQRKRSSITTTTPKDEFRKRVFSSDSAVQASDRNRCRSFDTDGSAQAQGQVPTRNSGGGPTAASRPRTQTHSQIQRLVSKSFDCICQFWVSSGDFCQF